MRLRHCLFIPYLIVPLAIVVAFAAPQSFFFKRPSEFLLYGYIFVFPHILASPLMFFDKKYFQEYRVKIIVASLLSITLALLLREVSSDYKGLFLFFAAIMHLTGQQVGIGLRLHARPHNFWMRAWEWSLVFFVTTVYFLMVLLNVKVPVNYYWGFIGFSSLLLFKGGLLKGRTVGILYLMLNQVVVVLVAVFFLQGLYFFSILLPRFIHDTTAFMVYIFHNEKRNEKENNNFIFSNKYIIFLPVFISTPLILFSLNAIVVQPAENLSWFWLLDALVLFHYIAEHFCWKGASLLREQIRL